MTRKLLPRLASSLGLFALIACTMPSCSTKYQDLLNDRDSQIRELNMRLSEARSGLTDAERAAQEARDALAKERTKTASDAGAKAQDSDLNRLKADLPEADVRYSRGHISIGIDNSITFDSGSEKIKPGGEKVLRKVADVLKARFAGRRIYIEGHTDTDPINRTKDKYEDNLELSLERAKAVRSYLVKGCNIGQRNVAVVGFGEYDPRNTGQGDASKSKNRRVEIVVGESF